MFFFYLKKKIYGITYLWPVMSLLAVNLSPDRKRMKADGWIEHKHLESLFVSAALMELLLLLMIFHRKGNISLLYVLRKWNANSHSLGLMNCLKNKMCILESKSGLNTPPRFSNRHADREQNKNRLDQTEWILRLALTQWAKSCQQTHPRERN